MIKTIKGPGFSDSQIIGQDAAAALNANKPKFWTLGVKPGEDFGYDYEATVFGQNGEGAQFFINIQLKGTTQHDDLSADKFFISHSFNKTTLDFWHTSASPIVVAIANLIEVEDPKYAPVHYKFLSYEIEEILQHTPQDQKYITLRIPTNIFINRDLDIIPVIRPYLDEINEARALLRRQRQSNSVTASESIGFPTNLPELGLIKAEDENSDIDKLINALPNNELYKSLLESLRIGDSERVLDQIHSPTQELISTSPLEAALMAYLRSRALEDTGSSVESEVLLNLAAKLLPDNDEIQAAVFQNKLERIEFGEAGEQERLQLLQAIDTYDGPYVAGSKARLLALSGRFEEARNVITGYEPQKMVIIIPVISIVERNWQRALDELNEGKSITNLRPKVRFLLKALEARCFFELALFNVDKPKNGTLIVPSAGLPNIDYDKLKTAYDFSLDAIQKAQRLNWPTATQYLIDVFSISSMIFEKMDVGLQYLSLFALSKPYITSIRELVSRLSVQYEDPKIALKLDEISKGLAPFENQPSVIAIANLKAGNPTKALEFLDERFFETAVPNDIYYSSLLALGITADAMLQHDLLAKIKSVLGATSESSHYLAILDSAVTVQHSQLSRQEAIRNLVNYWRNNGRPVFIAYHIINNSDPNNRDEAEWIACISESLLGEHSLAAEHFLAYGYALLTLDKNQEAADVLEQACFRFEEDGQLKSLYGIALEIIGQSAKSFEIIENLLESGEATESARRYFSNIAIRMGFLSKAEAQIRSALGKSSDRYKRLSLLNTLFQLLIASENREIDAEAIAWEYGALADQNNEKEEGIFLQEYLTATLPDNIEYDQDRLTEFRARMDRYSATFPNSRIIWRAEMPVDGSPEELLKALKAASGITDKEIESARKIERQLDNGLPIPFSWRPKRYLRNISDIFMLWEISKRTPIEKNAFHFSCYIDGDEAATPVITNESEVVISLLSLIVLDEVAVLEDALLAFSKVVIARATIMTLQTARSPFSGILGNTQATRIMSLLQKYFQKITHPPMIKSEALDHYAPWTDEEKIAMLSSNRIYMCDDIVESAFVCGLDGNKIDKPRITTLDFLHWSDEIAGTLNPIKIAKAIGILANAQLGALRVRSRYLVAAIPDALQLASTEDMENQALFDATTLRSILDGIWPPNKSFQTLLQHFAFNLAYLIRDGKANQPVLVALWLRWLQAVRFKTDNDLTPMEKMGTGFVQCLAHLDDNAESIAKLWQSFWTSLGRGFRSDLTDAEDRSGVKIIAKILGSYFPHQNEHGILVGPLFTRASLSLASDTEIGDLFKSHFINEVGITSQQLFGDQKNSPN